MNQPYTITYSNHFKVDNKTFAFRKKLLFDVTETPVYKPMLNNNGSIGVWVNRKWISLSAMKKLIINEPLTVDVSNEQWHIQEQLNHCFNLN